MSTLAQLRQAVGKASDDLSNLIDDPKAFEAKEAELEELKGKLARALKAQRAAAALAQPLGGQGDPAEVNPQDRTLSQIRAMHPHQGRLKGYEDYLALARKGLEFTPDRSVHFRSLGEQLQAIQQYYSSRGSNADGRLVRAPTGAGEVDPTGGGFLVQIDFATSIFMLAHDMGELLARVNKIPIGPNANGLKMPGIDETSRVTGSRWGGVSSAWVAEGTAGTESRPKFRMIEWDLKKLISRMTVTDELLQDSTALTAIASQAFSEEVMWMTEDAIFEGTGAGQPLGIMNSPAKVAVAKETGQATTTIVKENIDKMFSRLWVRSMSQAVWLMNQDCWPQMLAMNAAVGTGGQMVFLPPGSMGSQYAQAPNATLLGRPVILTEYNATMGTEGDLVLWDLSQYTLVDKNGVQMASSMHIAFDTDEMRFRITYRVDGRPLWHNFITPAKGTNTRSPFITLASR